MKIIKFFPAIFRIGLGVMLLVSAVEKIIHPTANFLYVIEGYDFLKWPFDEMAARIIPWAEFGVGLFLVMGLWTRTALVGAFLLFSSFVIVVGQALLRGLALDECGCFGELISLPPTFVVIMDSVILFLILVSYFLIDQTRQWSLDQSFDRSS